MKKQLFWVCSILFSLTVQAQSSKSLSKESNPLLKEFKTWHIGVFEGTNARVDVEVKT